MTRHFTKPLSVALSAFVLAAITITACKKNNDDSVPPTEENPIEFKDFSVNPSLVMTMSGFGDVKINSLISSEDKLSESPGFIYGAQPDGGGFMKNPDGSGFIMINNHEINQSVSRVYLDKTLKPVKGEYILDYKGGAKRLCSATLAVPEIHGFGPMFLTAQESGSESMIIGLDMNNINLADKSSHENRIYPALGKASMENAVPLTKEAYPGKTIVVMGEDQSFGSSAPSAGQVMVYISNTVGDLSNGKLYALKRTDNNQVETDMVKGASYNVELVEVPNAKDMTGKEIETKVNDLKAIRFSRVEDVDYGKGNAKNNRQVYFTATGQAVNKTTPVDGYTMWGRVYRVTLDDANPLLGKLEVIAEGDSDPGNSLINPDNLCVTENYVYIQEDGDSDYVEAKHDSYIWQYSIGNNSMKPFINMNHKRDDVAWTDKYGKPATGGWEYGAMIDISDVIGVPNAFILNIHPHSWKSDAFKNPDQGGSTSTEGGQTVILTNVPR